MPLVAGIDSSTQSCKVVVWDSIQQKVVRESKVPHPDGTEVNPEHWWNALLEAIDLVGGLSDVSAISVAGQQHGMVVLDSEGKVIRPALLWNDTRSAPQADQIIQKFGIEYLIDQTGSVPVASFTSTKLLWLRQNEPQNAAKVAAVALPHDWLTWKLSTGHKDLESLSTDFSDASGTGYFNGLTGEWLSEIVDFCLPGKVKLPKVIGPGKQAGILRPEIGPAIPIAGGMGDNAAAAKGLGLRDGDFVVSIGTSGTVFGYSSIRNKDLSGAIAGFSNADAGFLPLVCTLNAARVLDWVATLLGVSLDDLSTLALNAKPGADGLLLVPYFEGERTPNLPDATASISGLTLKSGSRENFARASIEGMLGGLAHGLEVIRENGHTVKRLLLIGGAAKSLAVKQIAREIFSEEIVVPEAGEYVAIGAARQAAELI